MTEAATLKIFLCRQYGVNRVQPRVFDPADTPVALSFNDETGHLVCRLQPQGASNQSDLTLTAELIPQNQQTEFLDCLGVCELSWQRGIFIDRTANVRHDYLTFSFDRIPDGVLCQVCQWKEASLPRFRIQTDKTVAFLSQAPVVPDAAVPDESQAPDAAWSSPSPSDFHQFEPEGEITSSDPECVPGEQILLKLTIKFRENVIQEMASVLFDTPLFTGGTIETIIDDDTLEKKLAVDLVGHGVLHAVPTDFAAYQAGSWVFLAKINEPLAAIFDRRSVYSRSSTDDIESDDSMLGLINAARAANGLNAVRSNSLLDQAAQAHANFIAADDTPFPDTFAGAHYEPDDYQEHEFYTGYNEADRALAAGYGLAGGVMVYENVAIEDHRSAPSDPWSDDEAIFTGWKNSPAHWANILTEDSNDMGLATALSSDGLVKFWVQEFGADGSAADITDMDIRFRALPVTFNRAQNQNLVDDDGFEHKDMTFIGSLADFEASLHEATLTAVNHLTNTADLDVTWTRETASGQVTETRSFSGVAIFYHCPQATDTSDGHQAFHVGDTVLLLNEAGDTDNPTAVDLSVVGFPDRLRACGVVALFSLYDQTQAENQYLFGLLDNTGSLGDVWPVTDNDDTVISQPFFLSGINYTSLAQVAAGNGLVLMDKTTGGAVSSSFDTTDTTDNQYNQDDPGAAGNPTGDPPTCPQFGQISVEIINNFERSYDYTVRDHEGEVHDTYQGHNPDHDKRRTGYKNWHDVCGNAYCTFCNRSVGSFVCETHGEIYEQKYLLPTVGLVVDDDYGYQSFRPVYRATVDACGVSLWGPGTDFYYTFPVYYLNGDSETLETGDYYCWTSIDRAGAAVLFAPGDGQFAAAAEWASLMVRDSGDAPYTYHYQSRLRLYWRAAGDTGTGWAAFDVKNIESDAYNLFGTNRDDYLDDLPDTILDMDTIGLQVQGIYT